MSYYIAYEIRDNGDPSVGIPETEIHAMIILSEANDEVYQLADAIKQTLSSYYGVPVKNISIAKQGFRE